MMEFKHSRIKPNSPSDGSVITHWPMPIEPYSRYAGTSYVESRIFTGDAEASENQYHG